MKNKLIIAFTTSTTKLWPRIFCRHFRHCCVLFPETRDRFILVQIGSDGVRAMRVDARGLHRMKKNGWVLVKVKMVKNFGPRFLAFNFLSCVGFAKRAIGMRNPFIWTPDQLYKKMRLSPHFISFL